MRLEKDYDQTMATNTRANLRWGEMKVEAQNY
jgi:hypothetical protein